MNADNTTINFDEHDIALMSNPEYEKLKLSRISEKVKGQNFDYSHFVGHYMNGSNQYQFVHKHDDRSFLVEYFEDDEGHYDITFGYSRNGKIVFDRELTVQECVSN